MTSIFCMFSFVSNTTSHVNMQSEVQEWNGAAGLEGMENNMS